MPTKPTIKVADLDKTIALALKNFPTLQAPGKKPPLINGIVIAKDRLTKGEIDKVADGIIAKFGNPGGALLSKVTSPLPGGKIIVGFQIDSL